MRGHHKSGWISSAGGSMRWVFRRSSQAFARGWPPELCRLFVEAAHQVQARAHHAAFGALCKSLESWLTVLSASMCSTSATALCAERLVEGPPARTCPTGRSRENRTTRLLFAEKEELIQAARVRAGLPCPFASRSRFTGDFCAFADRVRYS